MSNVKYERRIAQYNNMNIVEVDDNEFEDELKKISELTDDWYNFIHNMQVMNNNNQLENVDEVNIVNVIYQDEVFEYFDDHVFECFGYFQEDGWIDDDDVLKVMDRLLNKPIPCVKDEDQYRFKL